MRCPAGATPAAVGHGLGVPGSESLQVPSPPAPPDQLQAITKATTGLDAGDVVGQCCGIKSFLN